MSLSKMVMETNQSQNFGNFSQQRLASSDVGSSKIKKVVAESVEVAIALCHQYLHIIGNIKLAEVVNQIIPTGWILSTGYWPYYSNQQGHCLCVCTRFGIPCRHVRNYNHWLDLSSSTDFLTDITAVALPVNASVTVTNFQCNVTAMGNELYNINAKFQLIVNEGGKSRRKQLWIDGNYKLCVERYASIEFCIMFHPNPQSMTFYGKILNEVLVNNGVQDTFVTSNSSKQTFITFPLNTQHSYTTIAFPMYQKAHPNKNRMFDAVTQTENSNEIAPFQRNDQFGHPPLVIPEHRLQTPSTSASFYNQFPPPYQFPQQRNEKMWAYKERTDRRGRRGPRGAGSSGQGFGNLSLSMFLTDEVLNQQPQALKGRKQKKATRRSRAESNVENVSVEAASDDLASRMNAELNLIDDLLQ